MKSNHNKPKQQRYRRQPKKEQKTILNSAAITSERDTEVLKEDLFSEVILDASGQDSKLFNDKWVLFFEQNQSFLKGLMAYVNNSHTLRNTLQNKRTMVLGDGFVPIRSEGNPVLQTFRRLIEKISGKENETEQLNDLIGQVNIHNETLESVLDKVVFDFLSFGNAFVELKKVTIEGQEKVYMYHIPVYMVALEKMNTETGRVENVGICQDWENLGNYPDHIKERPMYPAFDSNGCSVIHVKNYAVGFSYWGLPEYIAARHWAEIEYRIPKYNISKFKNGFVPSSLIQFYGNMTNEEAADIVDHVKESFTDTGKNSKMMVQVLRDPKYKANVQLLEDNHDGSYMDLAKLASQALVTANRMTMSTAGFATSGSLGSNQQMLQEIEFVTNTSIKGIRRKLLQEVVNPFIQENSNVMNGAFNGLKLDIANMNPVSFATSLSPAENLLINEQRRALGYDALDEETLEQLKNEKLNGTNNSTGNSQSGNT